MSSSPPPPPPPLPFDMKASMRKVSMHIDYAITTFDGTILQINKSSLIEFLSTIPKIDSLVVPGEPQLEHLNVLSKEMIHLIIALLQIQKDLFDNGLCLQSLNAGDIIMLLDCRSTPKLKETVNFVEATENMIDLNMLWLGKLLKDTILHGCNLPLEVVDFLDLFMVDGGANRELIYVNSAIVDLEGHNELFCTVHDALLKIMKKLPASSSDCNDILKELVFPGKWNPDVRRNEHLKKCYEGRDIGKGWKKKGKESTGVLQIGQPGEGSGAFESGHRNDAGTRALQSAQLGCSVGGAPGGHQSGSYSSKSNIMSGPHISIQSRALPTKKKSAPLITQEWVPKDKNVQQAGSKKQVTKPRASSISAQWHPKKEEQAMVQKQSPHVANAATAGTPFSATSTSATPTPAATSNSAEASHSGAASTPTLDGKQSYNRPGSKPEKEVLKYYRNSVQHGLDYAVKNGILMFNKRGLAIMLLFHFPLLLSSALKAIHKRAYLSSIEGLPRLLR